MSTYGTSMSLRKLFAILVAVAVLFAPALGGRATALAATADHHAQMMDSGHCKLPPSQSGDPDMAADESCCIYMCTGLAIDMQTQLTDGALPRALAEFGVPTLHLPYLAEIATPPPRQS